MDLDIEEKALIATALKLYEARLRKEREQLRELLHLSPHEALEAAQKILSEAEERAKSIRFKLG